MIFRKKRNKHNPIKSSLKMIFSLEAMKNQKFALFVTKKNKINTGKLFELAESVESLAFNPTIKGSSPLWVKISELLLTFLFQLEF